MKDIWIDGRGVDLENAKRADGDSKFEVLKSVGFHFVMAWMVEDEELRMKNYRL